jgi:hypothetical protein
MMRKHPDISERIEQTLDSLNGLTPVEPPTYFYTRLKARMQAQASDPWVKWVNILTRPVVAASLIAIILVVNVSVFVSNMRTSDEVEAVNPTLQAFADEYQLVTSTYFDYEAMESQ